MKEKGLAPIVIILLIAAAIGGYLVYSGKINLNQGEVRCTKEAKICPDGSSVGRTGPNCEFAACPTTPDETANWKTYTNGYFSIKYPDGWYIYELKNYPYQGYPGVIDQTEVIITTLPKFPKISAGDGSSDDYIGINIIKTEDNIIKPVGTKYPNGEEDTIEEIKIGGNRAYKITQPDKDIKWLIPSMEDGVIITVPERSSTSDYISKINQILSTLKFQ